ncbi:DUF1127 domain-containing protein [Serratia proteamaculans]|uniref:DUF1127 domain-containing protein n=1 Tax=Serratia proteamaculans TaxID=28151 RepID=UPI0010761AC1|nr:DUF1127 domain-containing protein [Serratia proteamaculans]TFZ52279.1 DUF1127 domain-containing protein [Serratia proteamaculans]
MTVLVADVPAPRQTRLILLWRLYWQRYLTRQSLLLLDDAQLADIGLTRPDARREGHKPFWRG